MDMNAVIKRMTDRMTALGVRPQTVSLAATGKSDTIRNWLRKHENGDQFSMRQDNLEAVAKALDVSLAWLLTGSDDGSPDATGFREETTPFTPKPNELQAVRALFGQLARHPQTGTRVQMDLPGLGLFVGDVVVMDLGREPQPGDLALVTVEDGSRNGRTIIRRYFPPYLLAMSPENDAPPMREDQPGVRLRYPIIGTIRGI